MVDSEDDLRRVLGALSFLQDVFFHYENVDGSLFNDFGFGASVVLGYIENDLRQASILINQDIQRLEEKEGTPSGASL